MQPPVFDWSMFWTIIGSAAGVIGAIVGSNYAIIRNFKADIGARMDAMDERIFLLATGKTLREAMIESKKMKEDKEAK